MGHFLSSSTLCFPISVSGGIGGVDTQCRLEELKEGSIPCRDATSLTAEIQISLRPSSQGNTLHHKATQPLLQLSLPLPPQRTYSGLYGFPTHTVG